MKKDMAKEKGSAGTAVLLTLAGCLIYAFNGGLRSNYGIMLGSLVESSGVPYAAISFILAVGQFMFGVMQPLFGVVALKKSNRFVLVCGIGLVAAGLLFLPVCTAPWMLMLALGLLLPAGTGALSFGIIMGTITPKLGEKRAAAVSGIVTAGSGIGSTVLSPVIQSLLAAWGLSGAMTALAVPVLALLPVVLIISRGGEGSAQQSGEPIQLGQMFREAFREPAYRGLMIGFSTCGFHMAIIETHLYSQFLSYGFSDKSAAYAFSVYGVAAMAGSVLSGIVCSRVRMKQVLGFLYGSRAVFAALFLLLPKSPVSMFLFALVLGLTGNSTVVPTSGLVSKYFGTAKLATLFGIVFVCHQAGSFCSSCLGGIFAQQMGRYDLIWYLDIVLCLCASIASFRIREEKL